MIGQTISVGFTKLSDFENIAQGYTYTSNSVLTNGQYTFDAATRAFRAKKEANISRKINMRFADIGINEIHVGDMIEITCQCKNISGSKFKIGIDSSGINEESYTSKNSNEWEIMHIKHIVHTEIDCTHSLSQIALGQWSEDSGEFAVRDILVKIFTKANNSNAYRIISAGTTTDGTYVKYADGRMMCTQKITATVDCTRAWGSLYESTNEVNFGAWPATFINTPIVGVQTVNSVAAGWLEKLSNCTATNIGTGYFCRATSLTGVSITLNFIGIGKWK